MIKILDAIPLKLYNVKRTILPGPSIFFSDTYKEKNIYRSIKFNEENRNSKHLKQDHLKIKILIAPKCSGYEIS